MDNLGYLLFRILVNAIRDATNTQFVAMSDRVLPAVLGLMVSFATIWVTWQGYQVMTGQSRVPVVGLMLKVVKIVALVSLLSGTLFGNNALRQLTNDLRDDISGLVTGTNGSLWEQVDGNLKVMQIALSTINGFDAGNNAEASSDKSRALIMTLVGQGSPAMVGGILCLLNEIAVSMGIAFAPLFILALMFEKTAGMFYSWLKYMVAAMFSMGVLSLVCATAMVASAAFALSVILVQNVLDPGGALPTLQSSILNAGFGIVLTALIVSIPPMATTFIGGALNSTAFNNFTGGGTGGPSANTKNPSAPGPGYSPNSPAASSQSSIPASPKSSGNPRSLEQGSLGNAFK